jgi:hypothetical protein
MMKQNTVYPWRYLIRWFSIGLLLLSGLPLVAQAQEGQPTFQSAVYAAADGSSIIQSQEAQMTADFLAATGSLEGVALTAGGIALAAGQSTGVFTSGVINAPLASVSDIVPIWSAEVPAGSVLKMETRLSQDGSRWSDWVENPVAYYPVRDNQYGGSLIWVGGGQVSIQFRVTMQAAPSGASPMLRSVTLTFSDTQSGPGDAAIASQMGSAEAPQAGVCPVPKPPVVSRTMWGCPDGQFSPRRPPEYQSVTHIIIHHTATPNNPQNWAQVVRSIWNYHANTLWWGDIGYNYLIDPNGVIYEGRAGGDDVVGIHDNFNRGSMAIGFIGCYGNCGYLGLMDAQPSPAMLEAGIRLSAWKVGQKGLDPRAATQYGRAGIVPTIAGGRDVTATFSPGDFLYGMLPWLREQVAQRAACAQAACRITDIVFDKPQYALGDTIYVTARVLDQAGNPITGAAVAAIVTKPTTAAAGAAPLPMNDLTGYYQGVYRNTDVAGVYRFDITATDPTGRRFAPCSASASVSVGGVSPGGTTLVVEPERLSTSWCAHVAQSAVSIRNATRVRNVALEITYDPQVIQVVDADPYAWGVQVRLDGVFLANPAAVRRNEVDTDAGRIFFEGEMIGGQLIEGNQGLIIMDWRPQRPGLSAVTLVRADVTPDGGTPVAVGVRNGSVEVTPDCISGTVILQGRSDHSGAVVTSASGAQAVTDADGRFAVAGTEPITVRMAGFLSGLAAPGTAAARAAATGDTRANSVGTITLLAGDLNQDDVINVFDLAIVAAAMDSTNNQADLNRDGVVNILDVVLIANNFGRQGPLTDWQ